MLLTKEVQLRCYSKNKFLKELGYDWVFNKFIMVRIEDLAKRSKVIVDVQCDYCSKKFPQKYANLVAGKEHNSKDACPECMSLKQKETVQNKYGVDSVAHLESVQEKRRVKMLKYSIEDAKRLLVNQNCSIVHGKTDFKNGTSQIIFTCNTHGNEEQSIRFDSLLRDQFYCKFCRYEHVGKLLSGENSGTWNGGTTSINHYIRYAILKNWKNDSLKFYDYKCVLTGDCIDLEVHHLYGFNKILEEVFEDIQLPIKENISDYSEEELNSIVAKTIEYHYKYPLGFPLRKDVHKLFHDIYGKSNNTPEQFKEFSKCYLGSEFILTFQETNNTSSYLPYKNYGTSKYFGVYKKGGKYASAITYHSQQIHLGTFENEYLAAKAYNDKCIELYGKYALINLLDENDNVVDTYSKKYYPLKKNGSSKYTGIYFHGNKWEFEIKENKKRIYRGRCDTELEAVYLYNKHKIEFLGKDVKINYLTQEEINHIERKLDTQ